MAGVGLVEGVLQQAGVAVAIIEQPELGAGATIGHVNEPFARLLRRPMAAVGKTAAPRLRELVGDGAAWGALCKALQGDVAASFEVRPRVGHPVGLLSLHLTFASLDGVRHAVLVAHSLAASRQAASQPDGSQQLLAEIFTRIGTPVLVVTASGTIMLGNPALHRMYGYPPGTMHGMRVMDLTVPAYKEIARAAHEKQIRDGQPYELQLKVLAKGNVAIRARLISMQLRDGDQRFRVVTIIREQDLPGEARKVGDLRAVSLAAFRSAFGAKWETVAVRAMMKAEQIIRTRLSPGDVLSRADDHSFVIWFESTDEACNGQVLAAIVRMIRLRFITDFGQDVASHVSAAMVTASTPGPAAVERGVHKPAKVVEQVKWGER